MRNIMFYVEKAMKKGDFKSERQLCEVLELSHAAITHYRKGGVLPSDETMVRLAQIAGVDPLMALLDLNMWRTTGPAHAAYSQLLKKVALTVVFLMAIINFDPAIANAAIGKQGQNIERQHFGNYTLSHLG